MNIIQILINVEKFPNITDFQFEIISGRQRDLFEQFMCRIASLMMHIDPTPLLNTILRNKIELTSLKITHINREPLTLHKMKSLEQLYVFNAVRPSGIKINFMKLTRELTNLQILSIMSEPITIERVAEIVKLGKKLKHAEFNLKSGSKWNEINYENLSKIIKMQQKSGKLFLSLEKDALDMAHDTNFLIKRRNDPHVEIRQRWNMGRSVFNSDW